MRFDLLAAALLALAGCSDNTTQQAEPSAGPAAAAATAGSDAVNAVQQSAGAPVAQLQFVLEERPVVAVPFRLRLVATASEPLPVLQLSAESSGLSLENASAVVALETPGASATHELTAAGNSPGLAEVIVRLRTGPAQPETVYVVPLLISAPAAG